MHTVTAPLVVDPPSAANGYAMAIDAALIEQLAPHPFSNFSPPSDSMA